MVPVPSSVAMPSVAPSSVIWPASLKVPAPPMSSVLPATVSVIVVCAPKLSVPGARAPIRSVVPTAPAVTLICSIPAAVV